MTRHTSFFLNLGMSALGLCEKKQPQRGLPETSALRVLIQSLLYSFRLVMSSGISLCKSGICRFVKHIGQRTRQETTSGVVS